MYCFTNFCFRNCHSCFLWIAFLSIFLYVSFSRTLLRLFCFHLAKSTFSLNTQNLQGVTYLYRIFPINKYYSILISLLITDVSCKLLVNHYYISIWNLYFLRLIYSLLNVRAQVLDYSSNSFCYENLFHFIRTVHLVPDHMGHSIQEWTK